MTQHRVPPAPVDLAPLGIGGEAEFALLLARHLDVKDLELQNISIAEVPYDLHAITTRCRHRVSGTAVAEGRRFQFSIFVKVVQSWALSPEFQFVPPHLRETAEMTVPWRVEPRAYESELAAALPAGLRMPAALAVIELDDTSAAVWMEDIDAVDISWTTSHFRRAAELLGRFAASGSVRAALKPLDEWIRGRTIREYVGGRVAMMVIPALRGDDVWAHPLVTATFDPALRDRLLRLVDEVPALLDELDGLPAGVCHGDACTRNLLMSRSGPELVMIDFGFLRYAPLGIDLSQLILGEIQLGERPADQLSTISSVALTAYVDGLRSEGSLATIDEVHRAHAITMAIFSGLGAIPFELLDAPPSVHVRDVFAARARVASFILDEVGL